jgi:hypothetical protein
MSLIVSKGAARRGAGGRSLDRGRLGAMLVHFQSFWAAGRSGRFNDAQGAGCLPKGAGLRAHSLYIYSTSPSEKGNFAPCAVQADASLGSAPVHQEKAKGTMGTTRMIWEVL